MDRNYFELSFKFPNMPNFQYALSQKDQSNKSITKCSTSRNWPKKQSKIRSQTNIITSMESLSKDECPGKDRCPNYKTIRIFEINIQKLNRTIDQLTKINEYLNFNLRQREKLLKIAMDSTSQGENVFHSLSPTLTRTLPKTHNYYLKINRSRAKNCKSRSKKVKQLYLGKPQLNNSDRIKKENQFSNSKKKKLTDCNISFINPSIIPRDTITIPSSSMLSNANDDLIHTRQSEINDNDENYNQLSHYEKIEELLKKNQKNKMNTNIGISFLSLSNSKLKEIAFNDSINQICKITSSDELFIKSFTTENKNTLIQYCDIIISITKDFQSSIHLIQRIKMFLTSSVQLINSILSDNSIQVFIENTARMLSCEKAKLFLYDSISDKLISYTSDIRGLEYKATVPKDKGDVGKCFLKGQKIMLDHGYKQDDETSGNDKKIRNMICYPLYEIDGDIFGVIQAINKQNDHFNPNDEELLDVFSKQASAILQNMKNNETITTQLLRLKLIVNYSVEIASMTSGEAFSKKTEQIVMSLFSSPNAIVYFNDDKGLYSYNTNQLITQKNIGIISHVIKKKECHGCVKAIHCSLYNNIVDISTSNSLITFPIIDKKKDRVIGVLQTEFSSKLNEATEKPKKNDLIILNILEQCFVSWYDRNKNNLCFN